MVGFEKITLSKIFKNIHGKSLSKNKIRKGAIPVFGGNGVVGFHNKENINGNILIIGRVGAHCGNVHYYSGKAWITDNTIGLLPKVKINPKFFLYQLQNLKLNKLSSGSGQPYISGKILSQVELTTTTIKKQDKLVSKIESIFAQIDASRERLERLELQIKSTDNSLNMLKGSILKHTFEELDKKYNLEILDDVCVDIQPGFAQGEKDIENGIIHLRMNNIDTNFTMNFELLRTINATDKQLEKYLLQINDIIFVNTNSAELVGKSALFEFDKPCLYSNHLTRLRTNVSILNPKLLLYYLHFKWIKNEFKNMCNKWINQAAINTTKIKQLQIPILPLNEQKRIVEKLESIFARIDAKYNRILFRYFQF